MVMKIIQCVGLFNVGMLEFFNRGFESSTRFSRVVCRSLNDIQQKKIHSSNNNL